MLRDGRISPRPHAVHLEQVILGPDQVVNVAARVSKNAYLELRAAAREALEVRVLIYLHICLDDGTDSLEV